MRLNKPRFYEKDGILMVALWVDINTEIHRKATEAHKLQYRKEYIDYTLSDSGHTEPQELSERTINALAEAGISLEDAEEMTDADLLSIKGIGKKALSEIRQ